MSWGAQLWGRAPWGGPGFGPTAAIAVRENVIRVAFSDVIYASDLGDPEDALRSATFAVQALPLAIGYDGTATRDVVAVFSRLPDETDGILSADVGRFLDVVLDRPMTPFPAAYTITPAGVWNEAKTLPAGVATLSVEAVYRELTQPTTVFTAGSRDLANAQYAKGNQNEDAFAYPVSDDGDLAFDEGETTYEKRIRRVLITTRDGFAHLPGYGVGIGTYSKQLATMARVAQLITDAEEQIARDPETSQVKVRVVPDANAPSQRRIEVIARPRHSSRLARVAVPFAAR
jgi:hypothetical protein